MTAARSEPPTSSTRSSEFLRFVNTGACGSGGALLRRRAEMIPQIADGPDPSAAALSMYTTAHAADEVLPGSYWVERRRQADWLRERLQLDAGTA